MASQHEFWVGGSLGLDQGRYGIASDWSAGAAPQPSDVLTIVGVANSGIHYVGPVIVFPIGGVYTSVYLFPKPPLGQPINDPAALKGYAITGQTIDLNGASGAIELWLQHTTLGRGEVNVTGTAVLQTWLDNAVLGYLNVGTAHGSGVLEFNLANFDTAGVGIPGHTTNVTLGAATKVGPGSELNVESLAQGGGIVETFTISGTVTIAAGGTLLVDDTDGSGIITGADNNTNVVNSGSIQLEGAAGKITLGTITAGLVGTGKVEVVGNGAPENTTVLTLNGNVTNEHILVDDGVVAINDAELVNSDPSQQGFAVTGGSFTFGVAGGTLLLHQPPLTTSQFVDGGLRRQQRPDGQHPFTTTIFGFGQGDTIGLVRADFPGSHYVTVWDQATHQLSVEMPAGIVGYPPEIKAQFTLSGTYAASGFHLSGNSQTELLSLTYTGSHGA